MQVPHMPETIAQHKTCIAFVITILTECTSWALHQLAELCPRYRPTSSVLVEILVPMHRTQTMTVYATDSFACPLE